MVDKNEIPVFEAGSGEVDLRGKASSESLVANSLVQGFSEQVAHCVTCVTREELPPDFTGRDKLGAQAPGTSNSPLGIAFRDLFQRENY